MLNVQGKWPIIGCQSFPDTVIFSIVSDEYSDYLFGDSLIIQLICSKNRLFGTNRDSIHNYSKGYVGTKECKTVKKAHLITI